MSSSGGVFSGTLQSITTTKLTELSKKRKIFEDQKDSLLLAVQLEPDQKKRLRILVDGVKQCFGVTSRKRIISGSTNDPRLEVMLSNIERFLEQARYDPSVSSKLLQDWDNSLMQKLNTQSLRYEYGALFGQLVTEWLSAEQSQSAAPVDTSSETSDGFEEIHRSERDEQRTEWANLVFEPFETDRIAIETYLRGLFGKNGANKQAIKALDALRKSLDTFESSLAVPGQFTDFVLRWTIKGLLASGLLSDEKSAALKDFLANPIILAEVADVLNMRMAAIETWTWEGAIPVDQRRHVTGSYHMYLDPELLDAIQLQYIGIKFSIFFKDAFTKFSKFDGAWTSLRRSISKNDRKRRDYYLGPQEMKPSVQSKRQGVYHSIYFMNTLPSSEYLDEVTEDGEEEANYVRPTRTVQTAQRSIGPRKQLASKAARKSAPSNRFMRDGEVDDEYDEEDEDEIPNSSIGKKQFLLHLLSTEILVNTRLHGEITCLHSEFDSLSPSLPHSTIYAVLSFFGMSERWLGFFRKFLESPLKFVQDGSTAETRARKRGVPSAHSLSVVCCEAILFCLDYAVNQQTEGTQLYRMHDSFWIWSPAQNTIVKAWQSITVFSDVMGLSLDEGKTGTVRILRDQEIPGPIDASLPNGEIRWGFLRLDPTSGGLVIDKAMVDEHIEELQRQLQEKNKSVFSWIQAWNTYAGTFFKTNFGKPAMCFGREHIDMVLSTMTHIQRCIFSESNVVEYLKTTLQTRFGISDIPDGYLFFPISLGGLELQNPFIGLLQVRNAVLENPASALDDFLEAEEEAYRLAKIVFENGQINRYSNDDPDFVSEDADTFISFEEFIRYREEFKCEYDGNLYSVFNDLLQQPQPETVALNATEQKLLSTYDGTFNTYDGYLRWVTQLYGSDMIERFGGLSIVDAGLLPIGMVNLYRSGRVKWQG